MEMRSNLAHSQTAARYKPQPAPSSRAFTLVDILVSMTVIAVLMGLLLPSLSGIRETSRRVVCGSNIRQFGLGIAMYAQDYRDTVPFSSFVGHRDDDPKWRPDLTMTVRVDPMQWDGLGILFDRGYTPAVGIYYCPSHIGDHPATRYTDPWALGRGELIANYQFRGESPNGSNMLRRWEPGWSIVADGLATQRDFNHGLGTNALRGDFSVGWVPDSGRISDVLAKTEDDVQAPLRVRIAWQEIDRANTLQPGTQNPTGPAN